MTKMVSPFNVYEKCFGITLWRTKQRNVEIWFCAPRYSIKQHSHPNEDIELYFVFGRGSTFYRNTGICSKDFYTPSIARDFFRSFSILAGTNHWFSVSSWPLVFINVAHFKQGHLAKSACNDFHLTLK